ncbi:MAG: hypothetical protein JKY65_02120 [Planctomycetes bacterium]|nr:hypothetical protein [Planctomycetota bacterium]
MKLSPHIVTLLLFLGVAQGQDLGKPQPVTTPQPPRPTFLQRLRNTVSGWVARYRGPQHGGILGRFPAGN